VTADIIPFPKPSLEELEERLFARMHNMRLVVHWNPNLAEDLKRMEEHINGPRAGAGTTCVSLFTVEEMPRDV